MGWKGVRENFFLVIIFGDDSVIFKEGLERVVEFLEDFIFDLEW